MGVLRSIGRGLLLWEPDNEVGWEWTQEMREGWAFGSTGVMYGDEW